MRTRYWQRAFWIGVGLALVTPLQGQDQGPLQDSGAGPKSAGNKNTEPIEVLIVGGGSAHDFDRWFNREDSKILEEGGLASVRYTEDIDEVLPALDDIDLLYLSNNQPMEGADLREGIFDFVESGGGLLLVHAALWYNWPDWPEYNRVLAGGGSRGHDALGEFRVEVSDRSHPITRGLPETFTIEDELYYFEPDPEGSPIEVLATAYSEEREETFPIIWIVEHPETPIVATSLGHDGKAHRHPAFRKLLRQSVQWLAGRNDGDE